MNKDTLIDTESNKQIDNFEQFRIDSEINYIISNSSSRSSINSSNNSVCHPISNNFYSGGDQTFERLVDLDISPIPAGTYYLSGNVVTTDIDSTICLLLFFNGNTSVGSRNVSRGDFNTTFTLNDTANRVILYASNSANNSLGDTATFSNLMISNSNSSSYEPYEGCLYGLELYNTIESDFITNNYYINCGIIFVFLMIIILIVNSPFWFIRKIKGD